MKYPWLPAGLALVICLSLGLAGATEDKEKSLLSMLKEVDLSIKNLIQIEENEQVEREERKGPPIPEYTRELHEDLAERYAVEEPKAENDKEIDEYTVLKMLLNLLRKNNS